MAVFANFVKLYCLRRSNGVGGRQGREGSLLLGSFRKVSKWSRNLKNDRIRVFRAILAQSHHLCCL